MIRLPTVTLEPTARAQLDLWQIAVDAEPTYPQQVERAAKDFERRNKESNPTFRYVRAAMQKMRGPAGRCAYCEDSAAGDIEHIWPKDFYPERVFDWNNYLPACTNCNRIKLTRWKVRDPQGVHREIKRTPAQRKAKAHVRPPTGDPWLIDPRHEDTMAFFRLDLVDTFELQPRGKQGTFEHDRAAYTRDTLGLNRDPLIENRANVYDECIGVIERYLQTKKTEKRARLGIALQRKWHQTVWREMVRSWTQLDDLTELLPEPPSALVWW